LGATLKLPFLEPIHKKTYSEVRFAFDPARQHFVAEGLADGAPARIDLLFAHPLSIESERLGFPRTDTIRVDLVVFLRAALGAPFAELERALKRNLLVLRIDEYACSYPDLATRMADLLEEFPAQS